MKIVKIGPVINTIKPSKTSKILKDGTITKPVKVQVVDITLSDGQTVQIERPITKAKIKKAIVKTRTIDAIEEGDQID